MTPILILLQILSKIPPPQNKTAKLPPILGRIRGGRIGGSGFLLPPQLCWVHLLFILDQHPAHLLWPRHLLLSPSGCGHIHYLFFALLFVPPLVSPPTFADSCLTLVAPTSLFPSTTCCLLLSSARLIGLSPHHSLFLSVLSLLVASCLHQSLGYAKLAAVSGKGGWGDL